MSDFVDDPIVTDEAQAVVKRWALIRGGAAATVVESDTQPDTFGGPWVEAPDHVGPGWTWDGADWAAPVPVALPRQLSVGAFKDRLGMDALAIAVSTHPVCVAVREMLYDRKLVDLDRPDAAAFLGMMASAGQPEANPLFPGSGPMTPEKIAAILGAPIQDRERP